VAKLAALLGASAAVLGLAGATVAQGPAATIRTHAGVTYALADVVIEVQYTIAELKEPKEREQFGPAIVLNTMATAAPADQAGTQDKEKEKVLHGRRELSEIPLWSEGVEIRVPIARIQTLGLSRTPVPDPALPPYVPLYRYAASLVLVGGEQLKADHVSWGTAVLRGSGTAGTVLIPWEDVMFVTFER
jgi:hypothetical protein